MASSSTAPTQGLRIDPQELKDHLTAGDRVTILDARGLKAWEISNQKIQGAIRISPTSLHIDPSWPKEQLTVIY